MNRYDGSKNSMSGFAGMSQQAMSNQQMGGKFSTAFNRNNQLIGKPDFNNDGRLLHNNMGDHIHDLKIVEYKITIHTKDRDVLKLPSPFNIKIPCNSNESFSIKSKFNKVKYISLDSVILPNSIAIDTTHVSDPNLYPANSNYTAGIQGSTNKFTSLTNNRYLLLKIKELGNNRNLGTSAMLDRDTFMLHETESMGIDSSMWKPLQSTIIFPSSNPFELKELTMTFFDEDENELKIIGYDGANITTSNISGTTTTYNQFVSANKNIPSVSYTNKIMQVIFNFTVGHIENEMNIVNYDV